MKDTLKKLVVDCLNASRKGGSSGGVDPSKFPSQVWKFFFLYSYASKVRFMAGVMRRLVSARNVLRKDI